MPVFIEFVDFFGHKVFVNANTILSVCEAPYGTSIRTAHGTYVVQMSVSEINRLLRIANQLEADK